jgi:hypothetical protein
VEGTAVLFALGIRFGPDGPDTNTMEHLLGTDGRKPAAKHRILEMYVEHGFEPPDTPVMALHRGRIDLLEAHLARDPDLLTRTFDVTEIYPLAPASWTEPYRAQGMPVHGTTLLHIAASFDELEIGEWLLGRGMDPNARAAIDADGFGGYTALFSTVVSAQLLGQLRQGTAGRSTLHAPPAGPRCRPERPCVPPGAPRGWTWRRTPSRVS